MALSERQVRTSLRLWRGRRKIYKKLLVNTNEKIAAREKQLAEILAAQSAEATWTPKIVGHDVSGLNPTNVFGPLGLENKVTTHYAASARARNLGEGLVLARQFDAFHRSKGWGGVSYHYLIPDTGELILGRSTYHKGAHVLNTNAGNVGINFFCTAGHHPTPEQARTYMWLLANAHTDALPVKHRTDRDLRQADIRPHNGWQGQATQCPGNFTPANLKRIASQ